MSKRTTIYLKILAVTIYAINTAVTISQNRLADHNALNHQMTEIIDRVFRRSLITGTSTWEPQEIKDMLDAHNLYRAQTANGNTPAYGQAANGYTNYQPSASNMNKLHWDKAIEKVATDYAKACYYEHNTHTASDMIASGMEALASFRYPSSAPTNGVKLGENLYYSSITTPQMHYIWNGKDYGIMGSVDSWHNESWDYTFDSRACAPGKVCGHYTAEVWSNSRYIGCGFSQCDNPTQASGDSKLWARLFVVCNYWPPGNVIGQYPYIEGEPCSQCDADRIICDNGLCAGGMSSEFVATGSTNIDQCDDGTGIDVCATVNPTATSLSPSEFPTVYTPTPIITTRSPTENTPSPSATTLFPTALPTAYHEDVCIWGRKGVTNNVINGLYTYQGEYNGSPYYRKDIDPSWSGSTLYLWQQAGNYYITTYAPRVESCVTRYAKCDALSSDPIGCGSNWIVAGDGGNTDTNVFAQFGACPQWNCDRVLTTDINSNCNQDFNIKIGTNAWSNAAGDRFWYYIPEQSLWACRNIYDLTYGSGGFYAYTDDDWVVATKGTSVNLAFAYNPGDHIIQCIDDGTTQPTQSPIPTENPTKFPTQFPTNITTIYPTSSPTANPSKQPTEYFTQYPSESPTFRPTYDPVIPGSGCTDQQINDCCCVDCTPNNYMQGICESNGCQYKTDSNGSPYCSISSPAYYECIEQCSTPSPTEITSSPTAPTPPPTDLTSGCTQQQINGCCCTDCTPNDYMKEICQSNGCQYVNNFCSIAAPAYFECIALCASTNPTQLPTNHPLSLVSPTRTPTEFPLKPFVTHMTDSPKPSCSEQEINDCCCIDCVPNDYMKGICVENGCQYETGSNGSPYCSIETPAYFECVALCSGTSATQTASIVQQHAIMTIDGNYDDVVNSNVDIFAWAEEVIRYSCGSTTIVIIITDCRSGSIIIDYILQTNSTVLLDNALDNIDSTESINVNNFQFSVISNELISPETTHVKNDNAVNAPNDNNVSFLIVILAISAVIVSVSVVIIICYVFEKKKNQLLQKKFANNIEIQSYNKNTNVGTDYALTPDIDEVENANEAKRIITTDKSIANIADFVHNPKSADKTNDPEIVDTPKSPLLVPTNFGSAYGQANIMISPQKSSNAMNSDMNTVMVTDHSIKCGESMDK